MKSSLLIFLALCFVFSPNLSLANTLVHANPGDQKSTQEESGSNIIYIDVFISQPNVDDCIATSVIVPEEESVDLLKIFPNPNPGIFQIEMRLQQINPQVAILVYDTSGKMVFQTQENSAGEYLRKELDLSHLPKGFYFISVTEGQTRAIKQLIIQ